MDTCDVCIHLDIEMHSTTLAVVKVWEGGRGGVDNQR